MGDQKNSRSLEKEDNIQEGPQSGNRDLGINPSSAKSRIYLIFLISKAVICLTVVKNHDTACEVPNRHSVHSRSYHSFLC